MDREFIIFLLAGACLINGIFSPAVFLIWAQTPYWYPGFLPLRTDIAFYLSTVVCILLTLLLSGLVAGLYQRLSGRRETDEATLWVWLSAAALLTIPAGDNFVGTA